MPAKPKMEFPKTVFVVRGDEGFLLCDAECDGFEDGERVAIYELKQIQIKIVTHDLKDA